MSPEEHIEGAERSAPPRREGAHMGDLTADVIDHATALLIVVAAWMGVLVVIERWVYHSLG